MVLERAEGFRLRGQSGNGFEGSLTFWGPFGVFRGFLKAHPCATLVPVQERLTSQMIWMAS